MSQAQNFNADIQKLVNEASRLLTAEGADKSAWGEGIALLQEAKAAGLYSPQLEANLGKAYYKLENFPLAVEHLEKAVQYSRWNNSYRSDLKLAREKIPAQMGSTMEHPAEWGATFSSYLRPQEILWASSLLCIGFLAFLYFKKRSSKKFVVVGFSTVLLCFGLGLFATTGSSVALVKNVSDAVVRSAPLESAETLVEVGPGTRLRIVDTSGDFTEVERPNSFRGWIKSENIQRVRDL